MYKHLYDEIAKRWYRGRGNSIWIISDPHFSDEGMKYLRKDYIGDAEQVKKINSRVSRDDTLVILGDIGNVDFVKELHGYKVLIMGNHDKGASNYKREKHYYSNLGELFVDDLSGIERSEIRVEDNHLFDEVYEGPLMINDRVILSHEPIPVPDYMFNIHGHDHSNWYKDENSLNVCAEHINYIPVNLGSLIKEGLLKNVTDIHRETIDKAIKRKAKKITQSEE